MSGRPRALANCYWAMKGNSEGLIAVCSLASRSSFLPLFFDVLGFSYGFRSLPRGRSRTSRVGRLAWVHTTPATVPISMHPEGSWYTAKRAPRPRLAENPNRKARTSLSFVGFPIPGTDGHPISGTDGRFPGRTDLFFLFFLFFRFQT